MLATVNTPSPRSPVANHARRQHRSGLDDDPRLDRNFRGEAGVDVSHRVDDCFVTDVDVSADFHLVLVPCRREPTATSNVASKRVGSGEGAKRAV